MDFNQFVKESAQEINSELTNILTVWEKGVKTASKSVWPLAKLFSSQMANGKRTRGILVKLGYSLYNPKPTHKVIRAACAYEIVHTALLIHDDLIDQSNFRRGHKTIHYQLGNKHYGLSGAICIGDLGFFLAIEIINSLRLPLKNNRALHSFIWTVHDTILGELLDIDQAFRRQDISKKEILETCYLKTAEYSFVGPLQLGTILAGREKEADGIVSFGRCLGLAYQLQDDILGIFGEEQITGKSASSDIAEGKATLLFYFANQRADKQQSLLLSNIYGKKDISIGEQQIIKKIFIDTGALLEVERQMKDNYEQARNFIPEMTDNNDNRKILHEFIDYLSKRQK